MRRDGRGRAARVVPAAGRGREDFPFGPEHSVFKVAGKMFALSALDRTPLR